MLGSAPFPLVPCRFFLPVMPYLSHTMPESDEEVRDQVEAVFGFRPCLWQICVVRAILNGDNVITFV